MTAKITFEQLRVNCRFTFLTIHKCNIHAKYGEHTRAEIVGIVKSEDVKAMLPTIKEEKIEIINRDENGREEILFVGMIERLEMKEEGQYATLSMKALSYTWKMDMQRKSRSFQNLSKTYRDVMEEIMQEYDAEMLWSIPDKQLTYPLIQYEETDYCFVKRILSHLKAGMIAIDSQAKIRCCTGLDKGKKVGAIDLSQYAHSFLLFQGNSMKQKIWEKKLVGCEIENIGFIRVGDSLSLQGSTYYVMEMNAETRNNVLCCTCVVFPEKCFEVEKIHADTLRGTVITGKVLETTQEKIKLHLDIDKEQPCEEAYEFSWKPITGNMFYCMPEKGTKAALYFDRNDESDTRVIYNIRENGENCGELADYNNRYFTTNHKKRMYLKPAELGLLNMSGQNAEIALKDTSMLQMKTSNQISVLAEGQVELKGKAVTISTPKEATIVRKDLLSPTVINLCNAFDSIGKKGSFSAANFVNNRKKKDIDEKQQKEKYPIEDIIPMILANIPSEIEENSIMKKAMGSMPMFLMTKK